MVFNSDIFLFAFLPLVFALFWIVRSKRARYVLLALSGYVFYGYWNWRFCGLLLFSSLTSFFAGILISRSDSPVVRRRIMATAVTIDLSLLGFFKYYDFFVNSFASVLPPGALPILHVVLPIGISFYTFHTISYVVDVTSGRVKATRNLWEYLAYVNLFSQLVAGPIVRFRQIEDDLEHIDGPPREDWIARGIGFFMIGLAKKVMIADHIATGIDPVLAHYTSMSSTAAWAAALGYTTQLYFDFSGYSDMAVGLGYLFGLRIPQNFNAPYRAAGITDFWRRWHMSLSSFLRDYLYVPLGGNRHGALRTKVNLMLVMLLGGLWHGANWTFVVWGGYHGLLLIIDRVGHDWFARWPPWLYRAATFCAVIIGWVLFRSTTFTMAWSWLERMFVPTPGVAAELARPLLWTAIGLAWTWLIPETWDWKFGSRPRMAVVWAMAFVCIYFFMNGTDSVFLYYQF